MQGHDDNTQNNGRKHVGSWGELTSVVARVIILEVRSSKFEDQLEIYAKGRIFDLVNVQKYLSRSIPKGEEDSQKMLKRVDAKTGPY